MFEQTQEYYSFNEKSAEIRETLLKVYSALVEKGYDPVNQIVGYILSEDPTYITTHKNARSLIRRLDRDEILQEIVRRYIECAEQSDKTD